MLYHSKNKPIKRDLPGTKQNDEHPRLTVREI